MVQEGRHSYIRDPSYIACYNFLNYPRGSDPLNITGFKEATITQLVEELKKTEIVQVSKLTCITPHISLTQKKTNPAHECKPCSRKNNSPRRKIEKYLRIMSRSICCVSTHALSYDANTNRNKEVVHYLNQGVISLVLKLKAHLIPKILKVTLDIFSIFEICNSKQKINLHKSYFCNSLAEL